jgi:hypothetical protein
MRRILPAVLLLAAGSGLPLAAQERADAILGVVRDTALKPLAGIEVLLLSPRRSTTTDAAGRFRLDDVPNGMRHLLVRRIGFLPVHPAVRVPQSPSETLGVVLLPAPQFLPPVIVETERAGVRGVVGDTAFHALPDALVELLGARLADTTDQGGRFAFESLPERQYMLRVSRVGYVSRLISIDLAKRGQEYSIFLEEYRPGLFDWQTSHEAAFALPELATRLAMEPRRNRMTRAELERYGSMALCEVPRLRFIRPATGRRRPADPLPTPPEPNIVMRGRSWLKNVSLCGWTADEVDLLEWGQDPCNESAKTIAEAMGIYCGPAARVVSAFGETPSLGGRGPYVVIWPRN